MLPWRPRRGRSKYAPWGIHQQRSVGNGEGWKEYYKSKIKTDKTPPQITQERRFKAIKFTFLELLLTHLKCFFPFLHESLESQNWDKINLF